MTIIYVTETNCRCYGVNFEINGYVKVQRMEDISNNKNIILSVNPSRTFLGKSRICNMTMFSGAFDKSVFDGNTILLKIGEENGKQKNVIIGGNMVCSFLTNDDNYEYISNMGNNLTPYSIAIGGENYYLLTPNFNIIKKGKIDYDDLLSGIYPCEGESLKKLRLYKIHSN